MRAACSQAPVGLTAGRRSSARGRPPCHCTCNRSRCRVSGKEAHHPCPCSRAAQVPNMLCWARLAPGQVWPSLAYELASQDSLRLRPPCLCCISAALVPDVCRMGVLIIREPRLLQNPFYIWARLHQGVLRIMGSVSNLWCHEGSPGSLTITMAVCLSELWALTGTGFIWICLWRRDSCGCWTWGHCGSGWAVDPPQIRIHTPACPGTAMLGCAQAAWRAQSAHTHAQLAATSAGADRAPLQYS